MLLYQLTNKVEYKVRGPRFSMFKAHIKAVVLKLFQDEAHLCKVNYFVAPQKKTHDENILLQ